VDEFSRECLTIHVGHSLHSSQVVAALADLMRQSTGLIIGGRSVDFDRLPRISVRHQKVGAIA
jgi:hypothetical protein